MDSSGKFVVVEGIDGSGTTTQTRLLTEELKRMYSEREVVLTREPSNTGVTKLLRHWMRTDSKEMPAKAMCLGFVLDRYIHIEEVIKPALARGALVVSDRYKPSTLAYQTCQGLDRAWIQSLLVDQLNPDMYVLLDVPMKEASARVLARSTSPDRFEAKMEFQQRVSDAYQWAVIEDGVPCATVSAGGLGILEVAELVREAVSDVLQI